MTEVATAVWRGLEHVCYAIDRTLWPPQGIAVPEMRIRPA